MDWSKYRSLKPLIWLLLAIIGIYVFFHLPYFSIKTVQVVGTSDADTHSKLESLKGMSIFSQEVGRRVEQIKNENLTIADLQCSRGVPDTLRCNVSNRQPSILWKQGDKIYLVENNGFIYGNKVEDSSTLVIEDKTTEPLGLGKTVASSDIIKAYHDIYKELTDRGFIVANLYVADTLYQVGAVVSGNSAADVNWHPKTSINFLLVTSYPINTQADILLATVKSKSDKISERVDVRVPGYVYTK